MKPKLVFSLIVIFLFPCLLFGQKYDYLNKMKMWNATERMKYIDSAHKTINVFTDKLGSLYDSVVIVSSRSSVFQLLKKGDSLTVVKTTKVYKKKGKTNSVLFSTDTVYKGAFGNSLFGNGLFTFLFDIKNNATKDHYLVRYAEVTKSSCQMSIFNVQIFSKAGDSTIFRECEDSYLDDVQFNHANLKDIVTKMLRIYDFWQGMNALVKRNGPGIYRYSVCDEVDMFEYSIRRKLPILRLISSKRTSTVPIIGPYD